jgi:hypothetical protein
MRKLILSLALLIDAAVAAVVWYPAAAPGGRMAAHAETPPDPEMVERFVAEFDRNIQNDPVAADLIAHDPQFRSRMLRVTASSYSRGGWPAADDALATLMLDKQAVVVRAKLLADDPLVVALWRRYLDSMRALQARPAACRYYHAIGRAPSTAFATARREVVEASRAAQAAYFSGRRNIAAGTAPEPPSPDALAALLDKSTALGRPLTAAEWDAIKAGTRAAVSDAVLCAAQIKFFENILALPESEAAALIRGHWRAWLAEQREPPT